MLARCPDMQVVFMSGYTEGEIGSISNENDREATILQKPFELSTLATKIREVFETRSRH